MARETFTERFNRLAGGIPETELATMLGLSVSAVRKLRSGETQSLKLDGALRLCERIAVSPWYLAFGQDRAIAAPPGLLVKEHGNSIQISLSPGAVMFSQEGGIETLLRATAMALRQEAGKDADRVKAIDLLFGSLGREQ